jgi:hypothetical protein
MEVRKILMATIQIHNYRAQLICGRGTHGMALGFIPRFKVATCWASLTLRQQHYRVLDSYLLLLQTQQVAQALESCKSWIQIAGHGVFLHQVTYDTPIFVYFVSYRKLST